MATGHTAYTVAQQAFKQKALLVAPLVLPATTYAVFQGAVAQLGPKAGYFTGFVFYWVVWGALFPRWIWGARGSGRCFGMRARSSVRHAGWARVSCWSPARPLRRPSLGSGPEPTGGNTRPPG